MNSSSLLENANSLECSQMLASRLRVDAIRCTTAAGSGHPTSAMSAADLMAVLMTAYLRYDFADPNHPNNDRLIFSKGHAAPLLFAMFRAVRAIGDDELLSLRRLDSRLQGHPTPDLPYVAAATGSLGQGLPIGVGIALAGKQLDQLPYTVWVLLGDSEMAEGSVWEAFELASHHHLDNLVAIIDVNRLGQRGPTALQWQLDRYRARAEAFGWATAVIDGHDHAQIASAYALAGKTGQPLCIIAGTRKGFGVSFTDDAEGWHGRAMTQEEAGRAITELAAPAECTVDVRLPDDRRPQVQPAQAQLQLPTYAQDRSVATRQASGEALAALGALHPNLVVFDAEVANSTRTDLFGKAYPERFFEMFIAEQLMLSAAHGMATTGRIVFASTFAAFLTRAHDQIRMAAVSKADLRLIGSHAGVSIGEDGPSQMAVEDLAMMRSICGSTVLYPADAVSTVHLVAAMAERRGISYLRTTRGPTPVLYAADETFPVGGSKTLRSDDGDLVTLIGAGITVHTALQAADELAASGIPVRVIDCYSVKPIDIITLRRAAAETGWLIVIEDHRPEGGLGEAVLSALAGDAPVPAFSHLAVRSMPASATPEEQLDRHGLNADHVVSTVRAGLQEES